MLGRSSSWRGPVSLLLIVGVVAVAGAVITRALSARAPTRDPTGARGTGSLFVTQTPDEQERTLASLRRIDEHPLFLMTHFGPAPRPAGRTDTPPAAVGVQPATGVDVPAERTGPVAAPFACTVFVAAGDPARPVVGRNFDWDHHPALVLLADPPDGYASVSVVDISYLGYDLDRSAGLLAAGAGTRRDLLRAVTLPFDGMNEHGLVVAMATLDGSSAEIRPGRRTVGSVGVLRLLLDRARTVDEATEIIGGYNINFDGGPPLHYLVADATGDSAVIEFVDGAMRVLPREETWQLMVNFQLADSTGAQRAADWRYRDGSRRLDAAGGRVDWHESLALLRALRQGHTQWSVTYEPATGEVHLATGQRFDRVHDLRVPGR